MRGGRRDEDWNTGKVEKVEKERVDKKGIEIEEKLE